jgi:hypothetical protein
LSVLYTPIETNSLLILFTFSASLFIFLSTLYCFS